MEYFVFNQIKVGNCIMYNIKKSSKDEADLVWNGIIEYNASKLPLKSEIPFTPINRIMNDSNGEVIGGINCELN